MTIKAILSIKAMRVLSDKILIDAIVKTKNGSMFVTLYDRYASMIYNKCYGFTNGVDEAKDLIQNVF